MRILLFVFVCAFVGCNSVVEEEGAKSKWELIESVDEFGDKTGGKPIIQGVFDGSLRNSVSDNVPIKALVFVMDTVIGFNFYKHGNLRVSFPEMANMQMNLKLQSDSVVNVPCFYFKGYILQLDGDNLKDLILEQSNPIKAVMRYNQEKYNFEIHPDGLQELIDKS